MTNSNMRALRILHVTPYFTGAWAYGGIPRLTHCLVRGLAERGHEITVCTTDACGADRLTSRANGSPRVAVRTFPNLSNRLAYRWQLFLPSGLDAFLKANAASFDVAHLHACRNLPGVMASRHLRRARVPYVLAPNGTALRIERRHLAKRAFDAAGGRGVLRHADRMLAVSQAEKRQFEQLAVPESKVRVIPNPVDVSDFAPLPPRGEFRRQYGLSGGPLVLFLGQLTPRKRTDILARACARLRRNDLQLVIAGNDMGAGAGLRNLIRDLDLESATTFTGLVQGRDRAAALVDADVVVYPSQHEVFGLVAVEALLCGSPVIVGNDSGCGEVVASLGGGRAVPVGDVDALAAAIADVLAEPAAWLTAAVAAGARARHEFNEQVVCKALEDVYLEMAAAG
jgi:glycosyltransferase involved in cell wall biosynthesis